MRSEVKRLRIIEHIAARLIAYQEAGEPHFSDWDSYFEALEAALSKQAIAAARDTIPADPIPERCPSTHPEYGIRCGKEEGHPGPHTLAATFAVPWSGTATKWET
jgi:hypothetical protein